MARCTAPIFRARHSGALGLEAAQLPLYTIWYEDPPGKIAFAAFHCTGGDAMISGASLLGALLLFGNRRWPDERYIAVGAPTVIAGVACTIFSEWHNTEVRNSGACSSLMPTMPATGTGLSPLLQCFVVPIDASGGRGARAAQPSPVKEAS